MVVNSEWHDLYNNYYTNYLQLYNYKFTILIIDTASTQYSRKCMVIFIVSKQCFLTNWYKNVAVVFSTFSRVILSTFHIVGFCCVGLCYGFIYTLGKMEEKYSHKSTIFNLIQWTIILVQSQSECWCRSLLYRVWLSLMCFTSFVLLRQHCWHCCCWRFLDFILALHTVSSPFQVWLCKAMLCNASLARWACQIVQHCRGLVSHWLSTVIFMAR